MAAYERLTMSSLFSAAWGRSFVFRLRFWINPHFDLLPIIGTPTE